MSYAVHKLLSLDTPTARQPARKADQTHLLQTGGIPANLDSNPLQESLRAWPEF